MAAAPTVEDAPPTPEPFWARSVRNTELSAPKTVVRALVLLAVVVGVALRTYTSSELWLDEALTVNVANVGWGDLFDTLLADGAPPLFYVLLKAWIAVFGTGNVAVRALPAMFSVATIPLAWTAGKRRGGETVAVAALVLLATSPFAIRYATEARMYSLVALLVTCGWLAVTASLERPTPVRLGAAALSAGLLVLTHYWAFHLVGVTVVALALGRRDRRASQATAAAIIGGAALCFAPWVPSFLFQLERTGTPWGTPPGPIEVAFTTLVDLGGGPHPEGQALAGILAALTVLAVFGRAVDHRRIELDLRTRPGVRADLAVGAAALLVGVGVGAATSSAWASRYTAIAFPIVVLGAAYGVRAFADTKVRAGVLALAALLGLVGGVRNVITDRTQAPEVATAIESTLRAGRPESAIVVYCPDQLGPGVSRLLPTDLPQLTFPDAVAPQLVNWIDYVDVMGQADPHAFAADVVRRAGDERDIYFAWMPGYRGLDTKCEQVNNALGNARSQNRQLVAPDEHTFEKHNLWLHPARTTP